MRRSNPRPRGIVAAILLLSLAAVASAQGSSDGFESRRATVVRPAPGRALTTPSAAAPASVVAAYLRGRGASQLTVDSLRPAGSDIVRGGVTHLRMEQQVGGLTVYGSYAKAAVNGRGELIHLIENIAPVTGAAVTPARVDARQALAAAMARVHPTVQATFQQNLRSGNVTTFAGGAFFHADASVTAVAVPQAGGALEAGFLVETWTQKDNLLHHTLVGADGRVLKVELRTANDSYNVFTIDPGASPQAIVSGPGGGNAQSPQGWLGSASQTNVNIAGNNANAYLDTKANNRPDRGGSAVSGSNFLAVADLSSAPTTPTNQAAAVQNLFYLNNVTHDILYRHGFIEAVGNFQENNFGKGGKDGDAVLAEAQDGSGTDNANFATPPDGKNPRMQMFLWTGIGATHEVVAGNTSYGASGADFGPALSTTGVAGVVIAVDDGVAAPGGGTTSDGCEAIAAPLSGKIALINRGFCSFTVKVLNAQLAGALGVIIANNTGTTETSTMGGTGDSIEHRIKVPAVMVGLSDGATLRSSLPQATMRKKAVQPLQLDASLDSDVVYHEYGHGLTWRMIGGMSGPMAGAIGEGASDGVAMLINGNDVMGEYSAGSALGIRRFPYAGYPLTYKNVTGGEVHNDGEVFAAIVWRLIETFAASGVPRDTLFDYYVDGMNYTPATPAFENMRDGMLQAIAASGADTAHCKLVWDAFAQFGVGVGASGVVNSSTITVKESFTSGGASCN